MDLVSRTLDKYLKHRFNGTVMTKVNTREAASGLFKTQGDDQTKIICNGDRNGDLIKKQSDDEGDPESNELPNFMHQISISELRPCCVAISDNIKQIAIGFETSQIHLWELSEERATERLKDGIINNPSDQTATTSTQLDSHNIKIGQESKLLGHYGPVYSIEFINQNDLMLSCSEDTTIRLWCLNTKCNLAIYRGHNYPVWSLKIGPTRDYFASGSMDATARLWRFNEVTPVRVFCGHDGDVECLDFHPNSKYIATGSSDTTVRLWNVLDAKMVRLMVGHKHPIISLSFQTNGKFLASADGDSTIKIWNLSTNFVTNEILIPPSHTVSFNPEQGFISTCGRDNIIRLWKVGKSNIIEKKRIDLEDRATSLISAEMVDDKLFVIGYEDENDHQLKSTSENITTQ